MNAAFFSNVFNIYVSRAEHDKIVLFILHHRVRERRSKEEKIQNQQYFISYEENIVVKFLLLMRNLEHLVRIKYVISITFNVAC